MRTFVRVAVVLELHVGGRTIRTTPEHPFYVLGRGWLPAGLLAAGDLLCGHDGSMRRVDRLVETREVTTVYNLEVQDYHTYFVGCHEWGFSVWAHNADCFEAFLDEASGVYRIRDAKTKQVVAWRRPNDPLRFKTLAEAEAEALRRSGPKLYELGAPRYPDVLKGQKLRHAHSPTILGENLEAAGAHRPAATDPHHIVAGNDLRAGEARRILAREGIDINEAANGVFLAESSKAARPPAIPHSRVHTDAYYKEVNRRLRNADPGKVREELQTIAGELLGGTFPH